MIAIGWITAWLATLSLLLPLGQAWRRGRGLSPGQRFFAAFLAAEFLTEVTLFTVALLGFPNLWLAHLAVPVQTALIVRAFAAWQVDARVQLALRIGAPLMLLFWVPTLIGWEPLQAFSIANDSIQGIICVAVAAYTVVRRYLDSERPFAEDWFWIGAGVMLYYATYALVSPLASYLLKHAPDTAWSVFVVRALVQTVASVLHFRGMQCPITRQSFGPSISPRPPSRPFSWWRSGRP